MRNWAPCLYQHYLCDNYFPREEFLISLKTNPTYESYRPLYILGYTISLTYHLVLSCMLVFSTIIFICTDDVIHLFNFSSVIYLFQLMMFVFYTIQIHSLKKYIYIILFLFPYTNFMHSLLCAIFPDTIWFMVVIFMIFNCIFHNFAEFESFQIPSQRVSFNCGISATVCLASRFNHYLYSFTMLLLGFVIYSIHICSQNYLLTCKYRVLIIIMLFSGQIFILRYVLFKQVVVFAVIVFWINVVSPIWFMKIQKHKSNIYGPWDESN